MTRAAGPLLAFTPDIDLRPLRRTRRQAHRLRFWRLSLATLLLCVIALTLMQTWLQSTLHQATLRTRTLQRQLTTLRQQSMLRLDPGMPLTTETLDWLKHWLQSRRHSADSLRQLTNLTPDTLALTRLRQDADLTILAGHALSARDLGRFAEALARSGHWHPVSRLDASASLFNQRPVQTFMIQARLRKADTK